MSVQSITPFLWFVDDAARAIERYVDVFDDAEVLDENYGPDGTLFLASIRLHGQTLTLMNGGPRPQAHRGVLAVGHRRDAAGHRHPVRGVDRGRW